MTTKKFNEKPTCENHPMTIEKYEGTLKELAGDLSNLRYKELTEFLHALYMKLSQDATNDHKAGRKKLAKELDIAASELVSATAATQRAWEISKPYM